MSGPNRGSTRLVARVRALFPEDWFGYAGKRFRRMTRMVSEYTERHELRPTDVLGEAIELGRRKVEGVAFKEYATVVKEFADAEQRRIDTELQRRTIGSRIRKEEAEARAAELTVLEKELELLKKLNETGVTIRRDESGNLTVLPLPPNCDLTRIGKT